MSARLKTRLQQPSLTRRLVVWVMAALLVAWMGFVWVGYRTGIHETGELIDGHLAGTAELLISLDLPQFTDGLRHIARPVIPTLESHDNQPSLSIMVWDAGGRLLIRSGEAPVPDFQPQAGFATLRMGNPTAAWRSFSHWDPAHARQVMVLVLVQERDETATDVAGHLAAPGFLLLPIVALALGYAVWRGLRPLQALSRDVAELNVETADRLRVRHPYREFNSVVMSINRLVGQQQAALERERQLASEIAHELRTPLSSIALQAASLRKPLPDAERERALQQIGEDALRAGHVLDQLLALARASRADLRQQMAPLDVGDLARQITGDYAQSAWKSGHQLSVQGEGESLQVLAHPFLLGLALRNLISNALQHTAAGTAVCVQWGSVDDHAWLQVCDDGSSNPGAAGQSARRPADSLGLGHRIVARVMDVHGGGFSQTVAPAPFTRCYRLSLGAVLHSAAFVKR